MYINMGSKYTIAVVISGFLLQTTIGTEGKKSDIIDMVGHSFKSPLTYGSTLSLDANVVMFPSIPDKHGFMVHSQPISTNQFIATVDLDLVEGLSPGMATDATFGIWFVSQNISGTISSLSPGGSVNWGPTLKSLGFGMNGVIFPNFSGIGVIFDSLTTSISVVSSDGTKSSSVFDNIAVIPKENKISNFNFKRPGVKLTMSVNRNRGTVSLYIYDSEKNRGNLTVTTSHIPSTGYMGFSGYSGKTGSLSLRVKQLRSMNLDTKSGAGETLSPSLDELDKKLEKKNLHMSDLLFEDTDSTNLVNQQIAEMNKAISIVSEYLSDTRERDQGMIQEMMDLLSRTEQVEQLVNHLRMEIKYTFTAGAKGGSKGSLAQGIKGLKELIELHAQETQNIKEIKSKLSELDGDKTGGDSSNMPEAVLYTKLIHANSELEKEMVNANFTANVVIGIFGVVVFGLGILLYNKMRQYEKKHFL